MPIPSSALYPSSGLYPGVGLGLIREKPPLRLAVDIETPNGKHFRWGLDEHNPANVPSNLTFSSTMPGGFEQMGCTLPRKPSVDYPDLEEFSTVTVYGAGGETAWQGRLETTPRTSGSQRSITPGAVGWQAHLDDNQGVREIYVDADLSVWQPTSVQQAYNDSPTLDTVDATVTPDQSTGAPSLATTWTGPTTRSRVAKGWYDAKGVPIGAVYYSQRAGSNVDLTQTAFDWSAHLSTDDVQTTFDSTANLRTGGSSGSLAATATDRRFAFVQFLSGASYATGGDFSIFWQLAVVGNHGLPIQTAATFTGAPGVLASDVVAHAVSTWAPKLATSRAGQSTIETSTFIIPQLAFRDPTTVSAIIKEALQYGLADWWVDEGPTFNLASRANHGRQWRARVGPSGLQETGPQVDRMFNSVLVSCQDVTGNGRTAGAPGTGSSIEDASLTDPDPTNPVTEAGLDRCAVVTMGTSTAAGAIAVGQRYLAEQRQASTAGQAQIVGHVQDDRGVWWPAWMIRAGDQIVFTDAHDTTPRRIVKASYTDSSKACQIDLDSPPEGLDALLVRMSSAVSPFGFK